MKGTKLPGKHLNQERVMCQQFITIANMDKFTPNDLFPKRVGWFCEKPVTVELLDQDAISHQYTFRLTYDDNMFEFHVAPGTQDSTGTLRCIKAIVLADGAVQREHHHTAADKVLAPTLTLFYHTKVRCFPAFHNVDNRERSLSHDTHKDRDRIPAGRLKHLLLMRRQKK